MFVPLCIWDFLERASLVYENRTAVVDEPGGPGSLGRLTYGGLAKRARNMAAFLDKLGVDRSARVAIVSPNSARFMVAFFGVSGFGRALVPVNFRLNPTEVAYILEHSGAEVLLVDPECSLGQVSTRHRIVLDGTDDAELFAEAGAGDPEPWEPDEEATCSVNYTSGTTARPKGVELSHRTCALNAMSFGWHTTVTDRDVLLHTLPMFHCNGWGMPYAASAMGARHVVVRKVDGEEILRRVEEEGVSIMCGAPAVVAAILAAAEQRRDTGRAVPGGSRAVRIVVAGAPPPSRVIERVEEELGWEFIQIYGLTETAPLLTINRAPAEWDELASEERAHRLSRAGVPAVGVRVRVGDAGEVMARSNHVFSGYWEQPDESEAVLRDGWFHTGDGGHMDGAYLVISDRKKDVIITGGENVSSIEVEDAIYRHPSVAEVAVIGVPDEKWGETVKALVVAREGCSLDEATVIAHCRDLLAHFKCPTSVEFRSELPRTATGKLQKFRLREQYWQGHDRMIN